jgi:hypothetical protein
MNKILVIGFTFLVLHLEYSFVVPASTMIQTEIAWDYILINEAGMEPFLA